MPCSRCGKECALFAVLVVLLPEQPLGGICPSCVRVCADQAEKRAAEVPEGNVAGIARLMFGLGALSYDPEDDTASIN